MPTFVHRHMTKGQWATLNPVLAAAEIGLEIGLNGNADRFKIGNGLSPWNDLKYFINETEINIDVGRLSEETLDARYSKTFGEVTLASMGDSLTEANHNIGSRYTVDYRGWADVAVLLTGSRIRYIGDAATGGLDIQQIRMTHLPTILEQRPTYCTVLLGQNSLTGFNEQDMNDIVGIYSTLMNAGITPILIGNPPTNIGYEQFRLNSFIQTFARNKGLPYFDMAAVLIDPNTGYYKPGMTLDDIHPNTPIAIRAISKAFATFLMTLLPARVQPPTYLLPQSKKDGEASNPLFEPHPEYADFPRAWSPAQTCDMALIPTAFGNKFKMTKQNNNRAQFNGNIETLTPGHEYYLTFRFEATVEASNGTWTFMLFDIGNNYSALVSFDNQVVDVPAGTVFAVKFKAPATAANPADIAKVMPAILIYGAGQSETGSVGATTSISQFRIRPIEP